MRAALRNVILCILTLALAPSGRPCGAQDASPTTDHDEAGAVVRQYFEARSDVERAGLATRFAAVAPKTGEALSALLHRWAPFKPLPAGTHEFHCPASDGLPAIRYLLRVPPGYDATAGRAWPLVVTMHGSGGTAEGQLAHTLAWLGADADTMVVASPQSPSPKAFIFTRDEVLHARHVLDDARRRVHVDSNRVVAMGYSKGGATAWAQAMFSPGEWAAAVPMAIFPVTDAGRSGINLYLANALPVRIQYHWGAQDRVAGQKEGINTFARMAVARMAELNADRFESVEYKDAGHNLPIDGARVRKVLAEARRELLSDRSILVFHHVWEGCAQCVRATEGRGKEIDFNHLPPVKAANLQDALRAIATMLRRRAFEIDTTWNREDRVLLVKTRNLKAVEIDLLVGPVNFERSLRVVVNGNRVQDGAVEIDYPLLLETARQTGDFDRLVGKRLTVDNLR